MKTQHPCSSSIQVLSRPLLRGACLRLFIFAVVILLFQNAARATSTLPFYEPFPSTYTEGEELRGTTTAAVWNLGNSPGVASTTVTINAALAYSGLATTSGSRGLNFPGTIPGSGRVAGAGFTAQTPGAANATFYASFLLNIQAAPTNNRVVASLDAANGSTPTGTVGCWINTSSQLQLGKSTMTAPAAGTTSALAIGTTHFIVLKYKWTSAAAGDDVVSLYLDPVPGAAEPASPTLSTATGTDAATIRTFYVIQGSASSVYSSGAYLMDEIRVSTNWSDVTPGSTCVTAGINSDIAPTAATMGAGSTVAFSFSANGSDPNYQWQVTTNGGMAFNNVTTGTGGASASYSTAPLSFTDNGSQFRCIATVGCDGSSVTSSVATVTVLNSATYSFRSTASGNWNDTNTWQQSSDGVAWSTAVLTPNSSTSNVTVRAGNTVAVTAPVAVDRLVIQSGGEVDASGAALTIVNNGVAPVDCDVSGILQALNVAGSTIISSNANLTFESTGQYIWDSPVAGVIPPATWVDGSTCEIENGVSGTPPTGLNQSFYIFNWNWPGSGSCNLNGQLTTVRNDLIMTGTASAANSVRFLATSITCNLTVGGDFVVAGGSVTLSGGSSTDTILNMFLGRNMVIESGAALDTRNSGAGSANNLMFTNTAVAQLFTNSGSITHTGSGGGCPINWEISPNVTLSLLGGNLQLASANGGTADSVNVNGTMELNGNQLTGNGAGTLSVAAGGTIVGDGTDQLDSTLGTINYGGTLRLPGLPALSSGNSFKLFDAVSYTNSFAAINPATPGSGLIWDTSQLTISGTLGVTTPGSGGSQPKIIGLTIAAGNFILSGSGGPVSTGFHVLSSTDLTIAISSWTSVGSGEFDSSGNFSFTNTINAGEHSRFYLISVP